MSLGGIFKIAVTETKAKDPDTKEISAFLTAESLANFAAMTGAIAAAWKALQLCNSEWFSPLWVPLAFAAAWGIVSILMSLDALKTNGKWDIGKCAQAGFIAVINTLVLFSAAAGAGALATPAK